MNVGASRGVGGRALFGHWVKPKNEEVIALPARGLGARSLRDQVDEITASTGIATFKNPVVHMWFPPNPSDRKPTADEKADMIARIEREFHLQDQPRVGVMHVLKRDMETAKTERHPSWEGRDEHEHYAWSLVSDSGRAVDHFKNDNIRRERVIVEWQAAHGLQITQMKHVTAVLSYLDQNNPEAASAVRAAGFHGLNEPNPSPTRIALYGSSERSLMERNKGIPVGGKTRHAFNARKDVLEAWKSSDTGQGFEAALASNGYKLAAGSKGVPTIIDPAGIEHVASKLIGEASSKLDGQRIVAADVRSRLDGLALPPLADARIAARDAANQEAEVGESLPKEQIRADRADIHTFQEDDHGSETSMADERLGRSPERDAANHGPRREGPQGADTNPLRSGAISQGHGLTQAPADLARPADRNRDEQLSANPRSPPSAGSFNPAHREAARRARRRREEIALALAASERAQALANLTAQLCTGPQTVIQGYALTREEAEARAAYEAALNPASRAVMMASYDRQIVKSRQRINDDMEAFPEPPPRPQLPRGGVVDPTSPFRKQGQLVAALLQNKTARTW